MNCAGNSAREPSSREPSRRVLVRGVNWLGDAVMALPALVRLREKFPEAQIIVLTPEKLEGLYAFAPSIDRVLTLKKGADPFRVGLRLRKYSFDTALLFPGSHRSALEAWAAGIPERVGASKRFRDFLLTKAVPARDSFLPMHKLKPHEVHALLQSGGSRKSFPAASHHCYQYLHLVSRGLGANEAPVAPALVVNPADLKATRNRFELNRALPVIGLNPGAEYGAAKRWPSEFFGKAAAEVLKQHPAQCIVFGGKADKQLCENLACSINAIVPGSTRNMAGRTSLQELVHLVKLCDVLVSNDTGPMHLAAALQTPLVAMFGSTSPELTGPFNNSQSIVMTGDAPCAPCFMRECPADFRCLRSLLPEDVARAALKLLSFGHPLPSLAAV